MSIFFTDDFTGANDDPWDSSKWTVTTNVDSGATAVASIQSNHGRLRTTGNGSGILPSMHAIADVVDADHTDIDLLITGLTYTGPASERILCVFIRASGDWDNVVNPDTGYRVLLGPGSSEFTLFRIDTAAEASLDTATWTPGQNNNLRIRMVGSDIEVTIWQEGTAEPGTPTMTATDATYASGTIQISTFMFGTVTTTTDWIFDQIDADDLAAPVDSDNTGQTADGHADSPAAALAETFTVFPEVGDGHADAPLATLLITAGPFPAAPTGVTAVAQSDTEILVSWNAVVGADVYDVERDSVIVAAKTALLSFSDTGLDASTEYEYRVRAARTP